jgi:UDP-glucose 4-epimerase
VNLLVVGGAGYIGSVVAEELVRGRHSVLVLDDLSTGHKDAVPALAYLVKGHTSDPKALREAFTTKEIDCVVHLAARSIVSDSVADPAGYEEANVRQGTILLDAMREHGVPRIVFSSTAAVYDASAPMPLHEKSPLVPGNPYGQTKLQFEAILRERERTEGLRFVALRYFNVAGASIDHGEDHRRETHLIPLLLDAARGARDPVPVYGSDYPTPDGTAVRDYVHIEDLAEAHRLALEHAAPAGRLTVFNLGSGRGASVREVVDTARRVTGRPIPVVESPRRAGDPARLVASHERAVKVLGWRPERGDLAGIVESAWRFARRARA